MTDKQWNNWKENELTRVRDPQAVALIEHMAEKRVSCKDLAEYYGKSGVWMRKQIRTKNMLERDYEVYFDAVEQIAKERTEEPQDEPQEESVDKVEWPETVETRYVDTPDKHKKILIDLLTAICESGSGQLVPVAPEVLLELIRKES
jgi:hypothetical protein